jgi:hypothetical protein
MSYTQRCHGSDRGSRGVLLAHDGGASGFPRLGLSWSPRIASAVLLPIPLVPRIPSTCPGRGVGSPCRAKPLTPHECAASPSLPGRLTTLTQSPGACLQRARHAAQACSQIVTSYLYASSVTVMHGPPHFPACFLKKCQAGLPGRHFSRSSSSMRRFVDVSALPSGAMAGMRGSRDDVWTRPGRGPQESAQSDRLCHQLNCARLADCVHASEVHQYRI